MRKIGLLIFKTHCTVGEYFSDCAVKATSKAALDEEAAEQLWVKSVEWTGL